MTTTIQSTGALHWAIRDSLLHYITVISRGTSELGGGAELTESGAFSFPLRSAELIGEEWHLQFDGSVRFTAHQGFLDINIVDPEIVLGPDGGVLATRTPDTELVPATIPLARTQAASPERVADQLVWTGIATELMAAGVGLFGDVYTAGTELSPLEIRVTLD